MSIKSLNNITIILIVVIAIIISGCDVSPPVSAESRLFLDISLEYLGEYLLPKQEFQNTPVGGLSGLTYDTTTGKLLAVSDDRSQLAPARFYTLNLDFTDSLSIAKVTVEGMTVLLNEQGQTYPPGSIDPEGIALSPRQSVFISSEGVPSNNIPPFIQEYDLSKGTIKSSLQIPRRYFNPPEEGVRENLGFESLTLSPKSLAPGDPFRLFTAVESSLIQDTNEEEESAAIRMMHYVMNTLGDPILLGEHLYLLEPDPFLDTIDNGLTELLALNTEGHFLALERTFNVSGFGAKIFEVVIANATDTSKVTSLAGNLRGIQPVSKKLLLDLDELGIDLDNLEGMTLGPRLPDGSQSLILVSDDNFKPEQVTQFLLFRFSLK